MEKNQLTVNTGQKNPVLLEIKFNNFKSNRKIFLNLRKSAESAEEKWFN